MFWVPLILGNYQIVRLHRVSTSPAHDPCVSCVASKNIFEASPNCLRLFVLQLAVVHVTIRKRSAARTFPSVLSWLERLIFLSFRTEGQPRFAVDLSRIVLHNMLQSDKKQRRHVKANFTPRARDPQNL